MRANKRGNGEGTVYQRADGQWCAALTVAGRQRVIYGRTRLDAAQKLARAMEAARDGALPASTQMTVGVFLEHWLENVARPRVRPRTYEGYGVNIRNHLLPTLGSIRLNRLSPQHVQAMINSKLAESLNAKTVSYVRQVLRTALQDAVQWNLVSRNVASLVPAPRKVRNTIRPLEPQEIPIFLEAIRNRRLEALYVLALATGVRQGEALGLKWADIDFANRRLRVQRQLQRSGGALHLVEVKSERARRVIDLPSTALMALEEHRRRQWLEKLVAGSGWNEHDLVFPTSIGTPLEARRVLRDFHSVIDDAGLPQMRFHDLRHSCATMLLVQGVPARVVMEILGHSQISLTMDTYSHVIPGLRRDAADRMEAVLHWTRAPTVERERS